MKSAATTGLRVTTTPALGVGVRLAELGGRLARVLVLPPEPAAALAATVELGCSTLLVLGLARRLATLPMPGMILTIQLFVYPQAWAQHLTWGALLLALLTRGAGALSRDRVLGLEVGRPAE